MLFVQSDLLITHKDFEYSEEGINIKIFNFKGDKDFFTVLKNKDKNYNNVIKSSTFIRFKMLIDLFCYIDDFCQTFIPQWEAQMLNNKNKKRIRICPKMET